MKKLLTLIALCLCAFGVHAQTEIAIVGAMCNVAQTSCVLNGDGGQVITLNPQSSPVTMAVDGIAYSGAYTSYVQTDSGNFHRSYDFTVTFSPTATLTGTRWFSRSGSGRGGWAWHSHFDFDTLTVY